METKSIKIPTKVHKELKVFTAQHEDNMIEFAGFAIMKELAARNHKFIFPIKKTKPGIIKLPKIPTEIILLTAMALGDILWMFIS